MTRYNLVLSSILLLCLLASSAYTDPWDMLFYTNAGDTCNDTQLLGCEYAYNTFWITGANSGSMPNKVYRLDNEGNYVDEFDQWSTSVWGWRDLTYDGTYLYGSDSYTIHAFDTTGTPMPGMNINGPISPCRALAYDPAYDHFWAQTFAGMLYEFGRDGTIYSQANTGIALPTGMAWDNADPNGPWLWIFDQSGTPATTIHQYDPYNHFPTGFSYTVSMIPGCTTQSSGGLAFTNEWNPAYWTLVGLAQAAPSDMLFTLEMYPTANPGNLNGRVLEAVTTLPIDNAIVVLETDTTRTDSSGSYQFQNIPVGTYPVTTSKFGYISETDTVEIVSDSTVTLDFHLTCPIIVVDVTTLHFYLPPGHSTETDFRICNLGTGELIFNIEISFENRDFETDEPWMTVFPDSGIIPPGGWEDILASYQAPDTAHIGVVYEADVLIHNNSVQTPIICPASLTIIPESVDQNDLKPLNFSLHQNTPNPFNPTTTIRFDLPHSSHVTLTIYNTLGQTVTTLLNQQIDTGTHSEFFDGVPLPSGIYFYYIHTANFTAIKKMVLIK